MSHMKIERPSYIEQITPYVDKKVIKVFTGVRRCGKSFLLKMIADSICKNGVASERIIQANFESKVDESVRSVDAMVARVKQASDRARGKRLYLFFDEIQELAGWEKLVNSLDVDFDVDIYLTGSNAKMLSSELATYLGGRYVEIHVYPLSFAEALPCLRSRGLSDRESFWEYVRLGGMPFIYDAGISGEAAKAYLEDLFNSIVLKDIAHRRQIRDIDLLERILVFHVSEIAHSFSPTSLVKYLKHDRRSCGMETIYNYTDFAEEACFLRRIKRYDLVGKELLSTQEKLYLTDHGFREAKLGTNERHVDRVLENIVAMELVRRGWMVEVGRFRNLEIDFVASKGKDRQYIQVAYIMPDEATRMREFKPLEDLTGDHFPRLVLSMDEVDRGDNGIVHRSLIDWCLGKD